MNYQEHQYKSNRLSLHYVRRVLKRRRLLILFGFTIGLGFSYLFLQLVPPKYKANTQVIFDPSAERVIGQESGLVPAMVSAGAFERVIALLESPSILNQVAAKLVSDAKVKSAPHSVTTAIQNILTDPQLNDDLRVRRLVWQLHHDLTVKTEAGQQIITAEYQSRNPQEAADIANQIMDVFIQDRKTTRYEAIAQASQWLDARLAESRDKLTAVDKKIEIYKVQHRHDKKANAALVGKQLRELQREREAIKPLYDSLLMLTRVKQTTAQKTMISSEFRILVHAAVPDQPELDIVVVWIGGCIAGLAFGIAFAFLLEYLDDKLMRMHNIEGTLGTKILARVPSISSKDFSKNIAHDHKEYPRYLRFATDYPQSLFTESLVDAQFAMGDLDARKVLMITSPMKGDGKTHVSANLASLSALLGKNTLLIDLDIRKDSAFNSAKSTDETVDAACNSKVQAFLNSSGMGQFVTVTCEATGYNILRPIAFEGAAWLRLLRPQMRDLLEIARQNYDRVWIDTAPAQVFPDASILARHSDGVVIVAAWSKTSIKLLKETIDLIRSGGGEVLGVIVNKVKVDRLISAAMVSYKDYYYGLKRVIA